MNDDSKHSNKLNTSNNEQQVIKILEMIFDFLSEYTDQENES